MEARSRIESPDVEREASTTVVSIHSDADIVAARQKGRELARSLGFSAGEATLVATAISELARNVVQYAIRREVALWPVTSGRRRGIAISVRDEGPGIPDVDRALEDGFSTSGRLGLGLPGVRRLMDEIDIESTPGRGTLVCATKWRH